MPPPVAVPPVVVKLAVRLEARPMVPAPIVLRASVVLTFCVPALFVFSSSTNQFVVSGGDACSLGVIH